MIAFGPVPSRRLGRSLGVNNIPPKTCSYACTYCQLGNPLAMQADRSAFYGADAVVDSVHDKLSSLEKKTERIDYVAFVPDGEPTLDIDLASEIRFLSSLGTPVAVITNGSLLCRADVRWALQAADWVSVKVDAVEEPVWRRVDRPHRSLRLPAILDGIGAFAAEFPGQLVTETMLVHGINDGESQLRALARVLERVAPRTAYLSVPTRPPAEAWVSPPDDDTLNRAFQVVAERVGNVELLIGYEGDAFSLTGDVRKDLLAITAVHPMRRRAVETLLTKAGAPWRLVDELVEAGLLVASPYGGHTYYVRRVKRQ